MRFNRIERTARANCGWPLEVGAAMPAFVNSRPEFDGDRMTEICFCEAVKL